MKISGKVSWFGGPDDMGVSPSEGLAFIFEASDKPQLFLPQQPPGTSGLARRLDPNQLYVACRWDYDAPDQSKDELLEHLALVRSPKTGRQCLAYPADWGPNSNTGRVADVSPAVLTTLGITTDDTVEVTYPFGDQQEQPMPSINAVAISAGHGKKVAGASGYFEESVETPKVMREVARQLRLRNVTVYEFWDQTSTTQQGNLETIVNFHNSVVRDLDVSCHFNASNGQGHGVEVLYVTQEELATKVSKAIADSSGLTNRGPKYNSGLYFLNHTDEAAILVETCFCDNMTDYEIYERKFIDICAAIAAAITGVARPPVEPPIEPPIEPPPGQVLPMVTVALTVPQSGVDIKIIVNGVEVLNVFE